MNQGDEKMSKESRQASAGFFAILSSIISIVIVACFFLPFFTASDDVKEWLDLRAQFSSVDENIPPEELKGFSIYQLMNYYLKGEFYSSEDDNKAAAIFTILIGSFSLFVFLSATNNRPILMQLNDALLGGTLYIATNTLYGRVAKDAPYHPDIAWNLYSVLVPTLFLLGICMFFAKILSKRRKKEE